jgi:hypothetical protein
MSALSPGKASPASMSPQEDLARIFNTALVSTRAEALSDFSGELHALMSSPAVAAILQSVRSLARSEGTSEHEAAQEVIGAFRKLDRIWTEYLYQEGFDRLRGGLNS